MREEEAEEADADAKRTRRDRATASKRERERERAPWPSSQIHPWMNQHQPAQGLWAEALTCVPVHHWPCIYTCNNVVCQAQPNNVCSDASGLMLHLDTHSQNITDNGCVLEFLKNLHTYTQTDTRIHTIILMGRTCKEHTTCFSLVRGHGGTWKAGLQRPDSFLPIPKTTIEPLNL
jgi:hypothetical protein